MNELKPRLISAKSKRGGSGFRFFLILLVTFALGVFVGTRINNINVKDIEVVKKKETKVSNSQTDIQGDEKPYLEGDLVTVGGSSAKKEKNSSIETVVTTNPVSPVSNENDTKKLKSLSESELSEESNKTDKYTLQVAAFEEMERAQGIVNELKEKGYYAYIVPIYNSRGEAWSLIKVGKFETMEEAQDFAALFQKRESMEAIVEELSQ